MDKSNESKSINPNYWEIATRQMTIVNENQQNKFKNAKIAVIGCGGIGGGAIEILARMGVGEINIIDEDDFDVSNLNRQLMSSIETLGQSKAESSKERVKLINPHTNINAFNEKLTEQVERFSDARILKKSKEFQTFLAKSAKDILRYSKIETSLKNNLQMEIVSKPVAINIDELLHLLENINARRICNSQDGMSEKDTNRSMSLLK